MNCTCGAQMVRNGRTHIECKADGQRWYCKTCHRSIVERNGMPSMLKGRPPKGYWQQVSA